MTEVEVIIDLLDDFAGAMQREVEGLSTGAPAWRPDPSANSTGITAWHVARWMDVLGTRILGSAPAEEEQWQTRGWAARTGYDPRGSGSLGIGAITGYTQDEVAAVPALSARELLDYLGQAYEPVREYLRSAPPESLYQPVSSLGVDRRVYDWLKVLLRGFFGHVGEIQALKAMRERLAAESKA